MILFSALYLFLFATICSIIFIPVSMWLSNKFHVLDYPIGNKTHRKPMPLLGGFTIISALLATVGINLGLKYLSDIYPIIYNYIPWIKNHVFDINPDGLMQLLIIMCGGIIIFIVGLLDDSIFFGIKGRLFSEFIVAGFVVYLGIKPDLYGIPNFISWPVTILWIVGLTNSFNLIDGMDGISGGVAFISAMLMAAFCFMTDQIMVAFLLITLCGSIIGFLKANWHPAKIYMGSCGSLFLGYMLATIPLSVAFMQEGSNMSAVFMPVLILSVPIYDTTSVMFIRLWNRRSPFAPDHNHIFHRIHRLGLSTKQVVLIIYLLTFAVGLSSMLLMYASMWEALLIVVHVIAMYGVFVILEMTGIRFTQRQQLVCYKGKYFFKSEDKNNDGKNIQKFDCFIRMLTDNGAELEISSTALNQFACAFADKEIVVLEIHSEEEKSVPVNIKSEIKSIWQSSDRKGFAGLNFIFGSEWEMRITKSYIASLLYPDRNTAHLEKQHKEELSSVRMEKNGS